MLPNIHNLNNFLHDFHMYDCNVKKKYVCYHSSVSLAIVLNRLQTWATRQRSRSVRCERMHSNTSSGNSYCKYCDTLHTSTPWDRDLWGRYICINKAILWLQSTLYNTHFLQISRTIMWLAAVGFEELQIELSSICGRLYPSMDWIESWYNNTCIWRVRVIWLTFSASS